jgi:hypothetical protein
MASNRIKRMLREARIFLLACSCVSWLLAISQDKQTPAPDLKGTMVGENIYTNQALGMTITLPGAWQPFTKDLQQQAGLKTEKAGPEPGCRGPLCGEPAINISIISKSVVSKSDSVPIGVIFLQAFKLSAPYLDRKRYPLIKFAESMTKGSMNGSGWLISSNLAAMQLGGRPAYRLLVHAPKPGGYEAKGFGYVAESNGYVFLMLGTAVDIFPEIPPKLQAAMEELKFDAPGK